MDTEQTVMAFGGCMTTSGVARGLEGGDHPCLPPGQFCIFKLYIFCKLFKIKIKGRGMDTEQTVMAFGGCMTTSSVARGLERGRPLCMPPNPGFI